MAVTNFRMNRIGRQLIGLLAAAQLCLFVGARPLLAASPAAARQQASAADAPQRRTAEPLAPATSAWWWALLSAALGAAGAILVHRIQQLPGERWKRAEYVRSAFQERYDSPGARNASFLLYWPDRHIPLWDDDEKNRWERVTDAEAAKAILPYPVHPLEFIDSDFRQDKRRIALNDSFVDLIWRLDHVRASAKAASVLDVHEIIQEMGELLDNRCPSYRLAPPGRLVLPAFRLMLTWRKMHALMLFFDRHGFDIRVSYDDCESLREEYGDLDWEALDLPKLLACTPPRQRPHWRIRPSTQTGHDLARTALGGPGRFMSDCFDAIRGGHPDRSQGAGAPADRRLSYYRTHSGLPYHFEITLDQTGGIWELAVETPSTGRAPRLYRLDPSQPLSYRAFFRQLGRDFGTALPREPVNYGNGGTEVVPLLTANLSPKIRYGYGDPGIIRVPPAPDGAQTYYLTVTSNDAPDAFPILCSTDLRNWELNGFAFPQGSKPAWALSGTDRADFWAPEIHRVDGRYLLCFSARQRDGVLAVGLATANNPAGPFEARPEPIVSDGAIDAHIFVERDAAYLVWKTDNNDAWPSALIVLAGRHPELVATLFPEEADRRTLSFLQTLWPRIDQLGAIQKFQMLQPLISAVTERFGEFRAGLADLAGNSAADVRTDIEKIVGLMETPVHIQRLDTQTLSLVGERTKILTNDQAWEGHSVEGMWLTKRYGKYFLFYSANDFATRHYGIGIAVADRREGPYAKASQPFLASTRKWWGPGHPCLTEDLDGGPLLLFHAFRPNRVGYKAFRALLSVPVSFAGGAVRIRAQG